MLSKALSIALLAVAAAALPSTNTFADLKGPLLTPAKPHPRPNSTSADLTGVTFQAFSGNSCDGAAGPVVQVSTVSHTCIDTPQRHSFALGTACTQYSVAICALTGCTNCINVLKRPGCYNVNTGMDWQSAGVQCG